MFCIEYIHVCNVQSYIHVREYHTMYNHAYMNITCMCIEHYIEGKDQRKRHKLKACIQHIHGMIHSTLDGLEKCVHFV